MAETVEDLVDMIVYEIHPAPIGSNQASDAETLPWNRKKKTGPKPITVRPNDGTVWLSSKPKSGRLRQVDNESGALAGFRFVRRRLNIALAMITKRDDVLVNGRPALPLVALTAKDSLVLAGLHAYVTERVKPYVGHTPKSLVGKNCPFCRIPLTEDTQVVTCRCGAAYHLEPKNVQDVKQNEDEQPLRCFENVRQCLSCGRVITREEYLEWDPANL